MRRLTREVEDRGRDARRLPTLALLAVTMLWPAALLAAPYAATHHAADSTSLRLAVGVYVVGSLVCHQGPDRSFHLWGVQLPVCARCTGLYLGAPVGVAAALTLLRRRDLTLSNSRAWQWALIVASLPAAATLLWDRLTPDAASAAVRAGTGAALGAVVAAFLAVASRGKSG